MDQIKIGKFIATRRKAQGLTQMQLAERLGITDRAVSKWETGKSLPDASIMLELCAILGITVNDLLCGEVVTMDNYNDKTEQTLLELVKQKETADKRLLFFEILVSVISLAFMLALLALGGWIMKSDLSTWVGQVLLAVGLVQFLVVGVLALRIEQVAGYYRCAKCGHSYVPTYHSVTLAMHFGRTRYMKCPHCGAWSWQKKVLNKDENENHD